MSAAASHRGAHLPASLPGPFSLNSKADGERDTKRPQLQGARVAGSAGGPATSPSGADRAPPAAGAGGRAGRARLPPPPREQTGGLGWATLSGRAGGQAGLPWPHSAEPPRPQQLPPSPRVEPSTAAAAVALPLLMLLAAPLGALFGKPFFFFLLFFFFLPPPLEPISYISAVRTA